MSGVKSILLCCFKMLNFFKRMKYLFFVFSLDLFDEHVQDGFSNHFLYGVLLWCHQFSQSCKCVCVFVWFMQAIDWSRPLQSMTFFFFRSLINFRLQPCLVVVYWSLWPHFELGQSHELRQWSSRKPADASKCLGDGCPETSAPVRALDHH